LKENGVKMEAMTRMMMISPVKAKISSKSRRNQLNQLQKLEHFDFFLKSFSPVNFFNKWKNKKQFHICVG